MNDKPGGEGRPELACQTRAGIEPEEYHENATDSGLDKGLGSEGRDKTYVQQQVIKNQERDQVRGCRVDCADRQVSLHPPQPPPSEWLLLHCIRRNRASEWRRVNIRPTFTFHSLDSHSSVSGASFRDAPSAS